MNNVCPDIEMLEYRDVIDCIPEVIPTMFVPDFMKFGKRELLHIVLITDHLNSCSDSFVVTMK